MKFRVLIVDDSVVIQQVLTEILEESGCESVVASNIREALQCVSTRSPDLILLDKVMLGLDGLKRSRRTSRLVTFRSLW